MALLRIEADDDAGVPSRILDLLIARDSFPQELKLRHEQGAFTVELWFAHWAGERAAATLGKIRQIPGVRSAGRCDLAAAA